MRTTRTISFSVRLDFIHTLLIRSAETFKALVEIGRSCLGSIPIDALKKRSSRTMLFYFCPE